MRKNILLLTALILLACSSFAQLSTLILYTEKGETFYVYLNGVKQNNDPKSKIVLEKMVFSAPEVKCKIVFSSKKLGNFEKTININPEMEVTYSITKINKKQWGLKLIKELSIMAQPQHPEPVKINQQATPVITNDPNANVAINYVDPNTGAKVNVSVNAGNNNGTYQTHSNVNTPNGSQTTTTTTQTTTTTYGTQTYQNQNQNQNNNNDNNYNNNQNYNQNNKNKHHHKDKDNRQNVPVYEPVPGYTGAIGCNNPMTPENFANVKQSISSKSFENTKLTIAKQVLNNNCLLTSQVKEIIKLFDFENTKLEFAKYAYGYTYDLNNYYMLNDAFEFEHSITELNDYISKNKK